MSDRQELEELRRLDELERKAQQSAPQQPEPTNSLWDEAKRQAGLTARALASAAGSFGAIPADIIGKGVNAIAGREIVPNQQHALQQTLTRMGMPVPERGIERFTQGMAESAPAFALPATLPAQVGGNAVISAAQAAPGDEGKQALIGGGFGAAGHGAARVLTGAVTPTPAARDLMNRGVALTPGQAAGTGSFVNRAEQYLASNPVSALPIRNAQRRGVEESNRAAAESVARLVDENVRLGLPPREAIEQTRGIVSNAYSQGLEGMSAPAAVVEANLGLRLHDLPQRFPMIPARDMQHAWDFVSERIGNIAQNSGGMLTGQQLKQLDSELGQFIRNMRASPNAADKTAAPAWGELQQSLREVMEIGQPDAARLQQLQQANTAYRQLLALERAMLPGNETFTPRRLQATLDRMNIQNTDLNRVANNMTETLPNQVPDSGTAERLLANALPSLLIGGGAGAQSFGYDTLGTGMMAAGALGSRPGARFLTGNTGMQQAFQNNPWLSATLEALRRVPAAGRSKKDGQK